jgi:hypothetical protein
MPGRAPQTVVQHLRPDLARRAVQGGENEVEVQVDPGPVVQLRQRGVSCLTSREMGAEATEVTLALDGAAEPGQLLIEEPPLILPALSP